MTPWPAKRKCPSFPRGAPWRHGAAARRSAVRPAAQHPAGGCFKGDKFWRAGRAGGRGRLAVQTVRPEFPLPVAPHVQVAGQRHRAGRACRARDGHSVPLTTDRDASSSTSGGVVACGGDGGGGGGVVVVVVVVLLLEAGVGAVSAAASPAGAARTVTGEGLEALDSWHSSSSSAGSSTGTQDTSLSIILSRRHKVRSGYTQCAHGPVRAGWTKRGSRGGPCRLKGRQKAKYCSCK